MKKINAIKYNSSWILLLIYNLDKCKFAIVTYEIFKPIKDYSLIVNLKGFILLVFKFNSHLLKIKFKKKFDRLLQI